MKKAIRAFCILGLTLCLCSTSNAQPGSGPDGFDDEPVDAPIDGGVSILVMAGIAYGYKKIQQKNSKLIKNQE